MNEWGRTEDVHVERTIESMQSHLLQNMGNQKVLRGTESVWSHLHKHRGDQEVLRGTANEWSHLHKYRGATRRCLEDTGRA